MPQSPEITVGFGSKVTVGDVAEVARRRIPARLNDLAIPKVEKSNRTLWNYVERRVPIYGLSTQFGDQVGMVDNHINEKSPEDYRRLIKDRQLNLVLSHNCGLGDEAPVEAVRATMLLRAHCLGQGYSGVRLKVVESLLNFVNNDVCPVVRQYGSIGASGDLIPLSAIAAALIGENVEAWCGGERMMMVDVRRKLITPALELEGREGLALINGTSFMTAMTALSVVDLEVLFHNMLVGISICLECLSVIDSAYDPLVHKLKNHSGSVEINDFILNAWKESKLIRRLDDERIRVGNGKATLQPSVEMNNLQDYYSLRSVPQGFGPFKENLERCLRWIEEEVNSVNDNPIIDADKKQIYHGANFMGYYVTEACDLLKMDIAQASTWLHAILANLVHPRKNFGLPTNLVEKSNIYSGFRPIQILAAALAVENRKLAQSHQAFMLPTEGDNQDVNSLGTHASFDLKTSITNLSRLTAIILLAGVQAVELRGLDRVSLLAQRVHKIVRGFSPALVRDRSLASDMESLAKWLRESKL